MRRCSLLKRAPNQAPFSRFGWVVLGLLFYAPALFAAQECAPRSIDAWAEVVYVYDGDTVKLKNGRKIRLIGINAPEIAHGERQREEPGGQQARQALIRLLETHSRVALQYGKERYDRYGRTLAHLFLDGRINLQQRLLEQGLAAAVAFPPNLTLQPCYQGAAERARQRGLGVWRQARYRGLPVDELPEDAAGFYAIKGRVESITETPYSIKLRLAPRAIVEIPRQSLPYFQENGIEPTQLKARELLARGWLTRKKGRWLMRVHYPSAIELMPNRIDRVTKSVDNNRP